MSSCGWSGTFPATPSQVIEEAFGGLKLSGLYLGHKEPEGGIGAPDLVANGIPIEGIVPDPDEFAFEAPLLDALFSFVAANSFDAPDATYFAEDGNNLIGAIVFRTNGAVSSGLFSTRDPMTPFGGYEVQLTNAGALLCTIDDAPTQQVGQLTAALNNDKWQTATVMINRSAGINELVLCDDFVTPAQMSRNTITIGAIPAGAPFAVGGSRIPVSVLTQVAMMAIFQGPQINSDYDHRRLHESHRNLRLALTSETVIGKVL